jgi:hypothetical protein
VDNWLKALVAAACICVIAVSGHYAVRQYRQNQDAALAKIAAERRVSAKAVEEKAKQEAALAEECTRRVPSKSTDTLKRLYDECIENNRPFYLD